MQSYHAKYIVNFLIYYLIMAKASRRRRQSKKRKNNKFSKAISSLRKMKSNDRYDAIRYANDNFIRDICSQIKKLKHKKLTPQQQQIVKKYRSKLKVLCSRRSSIKKKRQTLSQKGGFLPFLLPMIAPLITKAIVDNI